MQEALQQVRRDLGSQAIILSTKTIGGMRGESSVSKQRGVEVIAAIDYEVDSPALETKPFSQLVKSKISPWKNLLSEKDSLEDIRHELGELKKMVKQYPSLPKGGRSNSICTDLKELKWITQFLLRQAAPLNHHHFPEHLVNLYCKMLEQEVCEEIALKLIGELKQDLSPDALGDKDRVRDSLISKIERELLLAGPIDITSGRTKIAAFVGPTGVGKTTTVAKLAAIHALDRKKKVALITIDTYRIAAVEQLKVYATIMGLPFKPVTSPEELNQALVQFADKDLVMIDTAGRNQQDQSQIKEIKSFLEQSLPVEIYLVMSITHKENNLSAVCHQFGFLPIDRIIFTKLDESYTYGSIINQLFRGKKPLSYLTTGQKVPEDIEIATKERIISLMLGEADIHYC